MTLPVQGPVPLPRPEAKPKKSEGKPVEQKEMPEDKGATPDAADQKQDTSDKKQDAEEPKEEETYVPPPIFKEDPRKFAACMGELKKAGADVHEIPPVKDGNGCGIEQPIEVKTLGGGVALEPAGKMRCETARQLNLWTTNVVAPMLKLAEPGETLAALNQASTYICRKRNNAETGKISEHAHGNAIDIAGLTFKSGKTFEIKPREKDSTLEGALQRSIASAACLYFNTVLDPGSDKAHETHLHLDILKRRNGYRYCW